MIVRKRIVRLRAENVTMQCYRRGIVRQPEHKISIGVAYVFFREAATRLEAAHGNNIASAIATNNGREPAASRGTVGYQRFCELS